MRSRLLPLLLLGFLGVIQLDLDCAQMGRSRTQLARALLAEIEAAEDIAQAAFREALGRCPGGPAGARCRRETEGRFSAAWVTQKADIEARYERTLQEFEVRCRASIS